MMGLLAESPASQRSVKEPAVSQDPDEYTPLYYFAVWNLINFAYRYSRVFAKHRGDAGVKTGPALLDNFAFCCVEQQFQSC